MVASQNNKQKTLLTGTPGKLSAVSLHLKFCMIKMWGGGLEFSTSGHKFFCPFLYCSFFSWAVMLSVLSSQMYLKTFYLKTMWNPAMGSLVYKSGASCPRLYTLSEESVKKRADYSWQCWAYMAMAGQRAWAGRNVPSAHAAIQSLSR